MKMENDMTVTPYIRELGFDDIPLLHKMDTKFEDDYVLRVAERLMEGDNRLFGAFQDDRIVSLAGYSRVQGIYVMLGRLRSDQRFVNNGNATTLMRYVRDQAFQIPGIKWVGANTEENNPSARRVLEKINMHPVSTTYGAMTDDVSYLAGDGEPWTEITDTARKREWLMQTYVADDMIFPYECFYPFPATPELFPDEELEAWHFYENQDRTRFFITKTDHKRHVFLQVIYPWKDIFHQPGLWKTVENSYAELATENEEDTYIWYDMTKSGAAELPDDHPWSLRSPWILHGMDQEEWKQLKKDH